MKSSREKSKGILVTGFAALLLVGISFESGRLIGSRQLSEKAGDARGVPQRERQDRQERTHELNVSSSRNGPDRSRHGRSGIDLEVFSDVGPGAAPSPTYLSSGWGLSSMAKEKFGLSELQFLDSQKVLSELYKQLETRVAENCHYDEAMSQDGVDVYRVTAMSAMERDAILEATRNKLAGIAGNEFGDRIGSNLDELNAFGAVGKYDVVLSFRPKKFQHVDPQTLKEIGEPQIQANDSFVDYSCYSPTTGKLVYRVENADMSQIKSEFGKFRLTR